MTIATNLGYPRIGTQRELKWALEGYWAGKLGAEDLLRVAADLRRSHWQEQVSAGLDQVPVGDFSLYDHVLDTLVMLGATPPRFDGLGGLDAYFAMARGVVEEGRAAIPALEMTKWFDTNYHYLVPELGPETRFHLSDPTVLDQLREARKLGIPARPVILGPISFLKLSKSVEPGFSVLSLLDGLLPVYAQLLGRLADEGVEWVQVDEPVLVLDLEPKELDAFETAYKYLSRKLPVVRILLTTYFGPLRENLDVALSLPVAGIHLDLVRATGELDSVLARIGPDQILSLGLVDGRNVWRTDLDGALAQAEHAADRLGAGRLMVAPACSLLHSPMDLALEVGLDQELRPWLAFARQKLDEIVGIAKGLREGRGAVSKELADASHALENRRSSARTCNAAVQARLAGIDAGDYRRSSPYATRREIQATSLGLPRFPTTTVGSFPQTAQVRKARNRWAATHDDREYEAFLEEEIARTVRYQEDVGLDVLVHGEFERSDMVEFFAEKLDGFAFTRQGWVQSYGSRCVRPPVIYGDVSRPSPMTVRWSRYAQSLTDHFMKGMLTGPVTLLQWSFVRDDQPRSVTTRQLALALRDEVQDLESAGIRIIQIDEPAFREGLPLRRSGWKEYLSSAAASFRLASSGVRDDTQIHSHMCYSEFNDIWEGIALLDADVLSVEASRSRMEMLAAFKGYDYPYGIGPGVYDVHSPRVPKESEMKDLLVRALDVLEPDQLWVNPDCGLKTRQWPEVEPALRAMVRAARALREEMP